HGPRLACGEGHVRERGGDRGVRLRGAGRTQLARGPGGRGGTATDPGGRRRGGTGRRGTGAGAHRYGRLVGDAGRASRGLQAARARHHRGRTGDVDGDRVAAVGRGRDDRDRVRRGLRTAATPVHAAAGGD